jgi:hypothetical protein
VAHRDQQRRGLRAQFGSACHYCGELGETVDHIVPLARGGLDVVWNRVLSCRVCNEIKGAFWPWCPCPACTHSVRRHLTMHGPSVRTDTAGAYRTASPRWKPWRVRLTFTR